MQDVTERVKTEPVKIAPVKIAPVKAHRAYATRVMLTLFPGCWVVRAEAAQATRSGSAEREPRLIGDNGRDFVENGGAQVPALPVER